MSQKSFFDLIEPGMRLDLGCHTFTEDEIARFARKFDPQAFHLSEAGAKGTIFGNQSASGWHTGSIWMKHNISYGRRELLRLTGYEGPKPVIGPSPGLRDLNWPAPVHVGDTVSFFLEVTGKRKNPKRPGWGLLTDYAGGTNQHGKLVLSMKGAVTLRVD
jgi:acyl dehydratase